MKRLLLFVLIIMGFADVLLRMQNAVRWHR